MITVSVIVPSFNKEKYIAETILSVINQTYQNWELIIVDDVSTDNTPKIVEQFVQTDSRIKFYSNFENKGANYSRNFGLKVAKGHFIIFLDADDVLASWCIEKRVKKMETTDADICVFTMGVFKAKVGDCNYLWVPNSKTPLRDFLQHKLPWSILQPIWKKERLISWGGFDEEFDRLQDVELHTRALFEKDISFLQTAESPDCFYRIDEERKNFGAYEFLNRRVASSLLYCNKFNVQACESKLNHLLVGTIFQTYLQILLQLKSKHISKSQFQALEKRLMMFPLTKMQLLLFNIAKRFELVSFKIRGVNWFIKRLILFG